MIAQPITVRPKTKVIAPRAIGGRLKKPLVLAGILAAIKARIREIPV
jgi:hypothetical protein